MTDRLDASLGLNNYIASNISNIDTLTFFPGLFVQPEFGSKFILYEIRQNNHTNLWYYNMDTILYRIAHTDFATLQKIVSRILLLLNVENIQPILNIPGIRYEFTSATTTDDGHEYYQDQIEFYWVAIEVRLEYLVLPIAHTKTSLTNAILLKHQTNTHSVDAKLV